MTDVKVEITIKVPDVFEVVDMFGNTKYEKSLMKNCSAGYKKTSESKEETVTLQDAAFAYFQAERLGTVKVLEVW